MSFAYSWATSRAGWVKGVGMSLSPSSGTAASTSARHRLSCFLGGAINFALDRVRGFGLAGHCAGEEFASANVGVGLSQLGLDIGLRLRGHCYAACAQGFLGFFDFLDFFAIVCLLIVVCECDDVIAHPESHRDAATGNGFGCDGCDLELQDVALCAGTLCGNERR